jgi:hypothetical protein
VSAPSRAPGALLAGAVRARGVCCARCTLRVAESRLGLCVWRCGEPLTRGLLWPLGGSTTKAHGCIRSQRRCCGELARWYAPTHFCVPALALKSRLGGREGRCLELQVPPSGRR